MNNYPIIINCRGKAQAVNTWWDNALAKAQKEIMAEIDNDIFKILDSTFHFEYKEK